MIEPLESRIAPASVVFFDADGDKITITTSKGNPDGDLIARVVDGRYSVIGLLFNPPEFNGANITVSVAKAKTGDGQAVIGTIQGGTNNFGTIKIAGDLGDIDAGSGSATVPAIRSLAVNSFGRFDQRFEGDAFSQINGNVGTLTVKGDFIETNFYVTGSIGTVSVGGSVIGGAAVGDGQIYATENLGRLTIKKDLRGGTGASTGLVGAGRNVGTVTIGGSIYGGDGNNSGVVLAGYDGVAKIGKVTVGGSLIGGSGNSSGAIGNSFAGGGSALRPAIGTLTVNGSIYGGTGPDSGIIEVSRANAVTIGGSVYGGAGNDAGAIYVVEEGINLLKIGGDVRGGIGSNSGIVRTDGQLDKRMIRGLVIAGSGRASGIVF